MTKFNTAVAVLLAPTLTLSLAACGGGRSSDDSEGGSGSAGEPATTSGFDGTTINLGMLTPTSGPIAVVGESVNAGTLAWYSHVNEDLGGIGGKYQVELLLEDSKLEPATAIQRYNAIKDDVVLFGQVSGTGVVQALLPQLERDNILAAPSSFDSGYLQEEHLLPLGTPYQIQAVNGIANSATDGDADAVYCSLTEDSPYGESGLTGFDFATAELGLTVGEQLTFPASNPDFTPQVTSLRSANCDTVWIASTPADTAGALGKSAELGFAPEWLAQSSAWSASFTETPLIDYFEDNLTVVYDGPEWADESVAGMQEMVENHNRFTPDQTPDPFFYLGYIWARATTAVLEEAVANGDLSRDGINSAVASLGTVSFDGLTDDFEYGAPGDRVAPLTSTFFSIDRTKAYGLAAETRDYESDIAASFDLGD